MVNYLTVLRDSLLDQARDSHERAALEPKLAVNLDLALGAINRHVAEQRQVFNRQTALERQALIRRAAELSTGDHDLAGLPEANATVAQSLARMTGEAEEPLMQAARSSVWRSAIGQRLATGQGASAIGLFDRVKGDLSPADQRALEVPIQAARTDAAAEAWIARESDKAGDPLLVRVQADQSLSPAEKTATLAKIEARDSMQESARIATVKGLDDKREAMADALATKPGTYKPGALSALANAYEDAGEPDTAGRLRRLAHQESFLLNFARSSAAAQQRLFDSLPEGEDRAAVEAIRERQAEAFAKDAFAAGTGLYPEVGAPKPIDDMAGRIAQARAIAAYRGIPVVPFTADEIATMRRQHTEGTPQEREAVLARVNALPEDMRPALDGPAPGRSNTYGVDAEASMKALRELPGDGTEENRTDAGSRGAAHTTEPTPDSHEYRAADTYTRRLTAREQIISDRMISKWASQAGPRDEVPPELAERLGADQSRAIEGLVSKADDVKTDPSVLQEILAGLKSRNPEEARKWAQAPLYVYRDHLSAKDFAKLVELQQDLDPEGGYSQSELDTIRKQLKAADTSDLTPLYKALEPAPNTEYGTLLPFARDANGVRPAMPERARSFFKGILDLLAGTKTGELTPDAVDSFTTIAGGAGRLVGPRGGAETLAAGGKRVVERPYAKGHHWVPGPIRKLPDLSAEARQVFNNAFSGWYGELHPWSKEHANYNQAVAELWAKNKYNPSRMTKKDAQDFVDQIWSSEDPRIAAVRDVIVDKLWRYEQLREGNEQ